MPDQPDHLQADTAATDLISGPHLVAGDTGLLCDGFGVRASSERLRTGLSNDFGQCLQMVGVPVVLTTTPRWPPSHHSQKSSGSVAASISSSGLLPPAWSR